MWDRSTASRRWLHTQWPPRQQPMDLGRLRRRGRLTCLYIASATCRRICRHAIISELAKALTVSTLLQRSYICAESALDARAFATFGNL